MILLKRRYCRKHGHDLDPDPGDFVLHCLHCGAMVDMREITVETCGCGCGNPVGDA